jgi:hypothetical protein
MARSVESPSLFVLPSRTRSNELHHQYSNHHQHQHRLNKKQNNYLWNNLSAIYKPSIATLIRWLVVLVFFVWIFIVYITMTHVDIANDSVFNHFSNPQRHPSWVTSQAQPFNEHGVAAMAKHLIVVAGHSVTISGHLEDADHDESDWYLLEYQKHHGLPEAIIGHIKTGIEYAAADPDSLLMFSGGQTRAITGPESEGSSYYRVADAMNLWSLPSSSSSSSSSSGNNIRGGNVGRRSQTLRARTAIEEFATDSFQNLLFSICRFYEITGSYPQKITMVSYTFKKHRFETLHVPALHWPNQKFVYVGIDPPTSTGFDLVEATKGELENAAKPFENDPYGCHSPILQEKRNERNPFARTPPYELTCPDMVELMRYCGPEIIVKNKVPW